MINVKRILVPVDFSDTSNAAVKYGVALSRMFKSRLTLLHVEARHDFDVIVEGERVVEETLAHGTAPQADEVVHNAAKLLIGKVVTTEEDAELQPDYELRGSAPGDVAAEIIAFAKERVVDLVVMGTHGRGFVQHMFMGSVAEKVVREAPCPVLVVRPHEHEFLVPD